MVKARNFMLSIVLMLAGEIIRSICINAITTKATATKVQMENTRIPSRSFFPNPYFKTNPIEILARIILDKISISRHSSHQSFLKNLNKTLALVMSANAKIKVLILLPFILKHFTIIYLHQPQHNNRKIQYRYMVSQTNNRYTKMFLDNQLNEHYNPR